MLVLVVDDDPDFRTLMTKALEARGHEVETREAAFGLLNRVAGFSADGVSAPRPTVVALDHMLPGLPGADSLEMLAGGSRTRDIPVLLVSNGNRSELEMRAQKHPRCRFAPKTGRMTALVLEIEALVAANARARERAG